VAYAELDGTDVVRQFLGGRQRVAHQTRNALSQGVVEAFDVIRFAVCSAKSSLVPHVSYYL
jgi:hypothetical protein